MSSLKKKKFVIKKKISTEPKTPITTSKTSSSKEPKITTTTITKTSSSKEPKTTTTTTNALKEPKTTTTNSSKEPKTIKVTKVIARKSTSKKRLSVTKEKKFELSDVHKKLLRLAHNTYGLYSSLNLNDSDEEIKAYVKRKISSDPEKVIVCVYRDIENVKKRRRSSLLREPKKNNYDEHDD